MTFLSYLLPILGLAALCAAWMGVQLLARRIGAKNHIDHGGSCCGACGEGGCQVPEGGSLPDQTWAGRKSEVGRRTSDPYG